ncbi:hypothetical protein [Flavobacterium saccharophilum]|uniref:hypothetical protein n=1 Tax=Flavobacterium saccharophilum TaxID=29534 RepID=UPI0009354C8A|nr:hypothetical protein [Flavobacterium saccharophilum]
MLPIFRSYGTIYDDVHFLSTDLHPLLPTFRSYGTIYGDVHFLPTDLHPLLPIFRSYGTIFDYNIRLINYKNDIFLFTAHPREG